MTKPVVPKVTVTHIDIESSAIAATTVSYVPIAIRSPGSLISMSRNQWTIRPQDPVTIMINALKRKERQAVIVSSS